jgi:hypothetical protein
MFSVNQPWDPLQVCAVGSTYPPEYYSWIKVPHVRELFEKIAQETEEDFQKLIAVLKKFNVEISNALIEMFNVEKSMNRLSLTFGELESFI